MLVQGPGIPVGSKVINGDCTNTSVDTIVINQNVITSDTDVTLTFQDRIFVEGADLCGYGTEMAQKVVRDNGDLYMSGWNQTQSMDGYWNFNYYYGSENVAVPTYFDAAFA